jgi:Core-2/I-Branching enzyme
VSKNHAYLITAYSNRPQLEQLLSLLDDERNDVYLQVDSNGSLAVDGLSLRQSRLIILPPFPIYWGGFSVIQAELNMLRAASGNSYHYYHLLTGGDLPLVTQDTVHARLEDSEAQYVDFDEQLQAHAHWKAAYYHLLVETKPYARNRPFRIAGHGIVKAQALLGIDRSRKTKEAYHHGSAYHSITHRLVEHILAQEPWIRRTFRYTLACDEVYLQTLIMKSSFRSEVARGDSGKAANLRYIDWTRRDKNSPHTFRMADYEELVEASRNHLFARKFSTTVDPAIVDAIVRRIRNDGRL